MRFPAKNRPGYTLVELVVVVLILGILASIAAPRLLATSGTATDNGVRHTLSVIRAAIETYAAEHNGALPGANGQADTFIADLKKYLRGPEFPICPVDEARYNEVYMMTSAEQPGNNGTEGMYSWAYNYETGEFYINCANVSSDGTTTYDRF